MKTKINGKTIAIDEQDAAKNLLEFLREELDLTGSKNGCNIGVCGACTVLVDKQPVRACKKLVSDIVDKDVLTIEGMEQEDGSLHPLQQAFLDAGAIQCGFCTPGMVLAAHALLLKNPKPSREEIRKALIGNLCRCTGYQQIVDAVELASEAYQ
jgi:aerobic carbon-monoxide dehydrogenase small subunit